MVELLTKLPDNNHVIADYNQVLDNNNYSALDNNIDNLDITTNSNSGNNNNVQKNGLMDYDTLSLDINLYAQQLHDHIYCYQQNEKYLLVVTVPVAESNEKFRLYRILYLYLPTCIYKYIYT